MASLYSHFYYEYISGRENQAHDTPWCGRAVRAAGQSVSPIEWDRASRAYFCPGIFNPSPMS